MTQERDDRMPYANDLEAMKKWHNERGIPWGVPYEGPDPFTVRRMAYLDSLSVHLANEHHIDSREHRGDEQHGHQVAHTYGQFRAGQEHYHAKPGDKVKPDGR